MKMKAFTQATFFGLNNIYEIVVLILMNLYDWEEFYQNTAGFDVISGASLACQAKTHHLLVAKTAKLSLKLHLMRR